MNLTIYICRKEIQIEINNILVPIPFILKKFVHHNTPSLMGAPAYTMPFYLIFKKLD